MDKVEEFEAGVTGYTGGRNDNIIFDNKANEIFRYSNADELLNTEKGKKALRNMLNVFFDLQIKRLKVLKTYAHGDNYSIITGKRRLDREKADYRVRHKWGGYISNFATNYVLGNPVTVGVMENTEEKQLETIKDIEWQNDIDFLNNDLAFDTSVYGRAFEYHFEMKTTLIEWY